MHVILKFYIITKQTFVVVGNSEKESTRKEGRTGDRSGEEE